MAGSQNWQFGAAPDGGIDLSVPQFMGILNVTPDSFSDGGKHATPEAACNRAAELIEGGASVIDVGGESTRPGADRVSVKEQIARTVPVIEWIARNSPATLISIDTTRGDVADAAMSAGAHIINDVAAGTEDERILAVAAQHAAGLILMHRLLAPEADSYSDTYATPPIYDDPIDAVTDFLNGRRDAALQAGVRPDAIVFDPGLGFGKSVEDNLRLITDGARCFDHFPRWLSGASRKSFVGAVTGVKTPARRLAGSIAFTLAQYRTGFRFFRVHDVFEHRTSVDAWRGIHGEDTGRE